MPKNLAYLPCNFSLIKKMTPSLSPLVSYISDNAPFSVMKQILEPI